MLILYSVDFIFHFVRTLLNVDIFSFEDKFSNIAIYGN